MDNMSVDYDQPQVISAVKRGSSLESPTTASSPPIATLSFLYKTPSCMSLAVLKRLPLELFGHIFKWLSHRDKLAVGATALFFNRVARIVYVVPRSVAFITEDVIRYLQKLDPAVLRNNSRLTPVRTDKLILYLDFVSTTWLLSDLIKRYEAYKTLCVWPLCDESARLGGDSFIRLPYCSTLRVLDTPYLFETIDLSEYDTRSNSLPFPVVFPSRILDCNVKFQFEQAIFNSSAMRLSPGSSDLFVLGITTCDISRALKSKIKYTRLVVTLFPGNIGAVDRAGASLSSLSTVHFVEVASRMPQHFKANVFICARSTIRLHAPTAVVYVPFSIISLRKAVLGLIESNSIIWCLSHADIQLLYTETIDLSSSFDLFELGALSCPVVRDEAAGYEVRPFKRVEYTRLLKHAYNKLPPTGLAHYKSRFERALEKANMLEL